jgi:solute:Na+ symporter, SSS family
MNTIKIILTAYFGMMAIIGIYSYFKIKNVSDYFISGKQGTWWQITGSLFATIIGGSAILGTVELSQKAGWAGIWLLISASAGLFVLAIIAKKVSRLGHYTLPEMLMNFYGKKAERTATIMIPIAWTGVIAVQIIAGAKTLAGLNLMSYSQGVFLCGLVFIFYTLLGGQKSVIKTDVVQALIILMGLTTVFVLKLLNINDGETQHFRETALFNDAFKLPDLFLLLITYSVTFVVGPDIYSRIFCARNEKVARNSVVLTAILLIPVALMLTFLGVSSTDSGINATGKYFILPGTGFLPPWALGLLTAALLSAVMSSASTTLLTSSTIITELVTGNLDKKNSWNYSRLFILILGSLSILISLKVTSILSALLMSLSFFSGAFILPLIAGLAGWKVNRSLGFAAMISGGVLALSGKLAEHAGHPSVGFALIITAYLANATLLFFPGRKNNGNASLKG